jgi:hypothetical protein
LSTADFLKDITESQEEVEAVDVKNKRRQALENSIVFARTETVGSKNKRIRKDHETATAIAKAA